jgi:hypothetical protein
MTISHTKSDNIPQIERCDDSTDLVADSPEQSDNSIYIELPVINRKLDFMNRMDTND